MSGVRARAGFTVVELMIYAAVSGIVLTAVGSAFLTSQRMLRTAMAEAELSLAARQLRNRLLYQVSPPDGGYVCEGLLSATNLNESQLVQGFIEMKGRTVGPSILDVGAQSIRLMPWQSDGEHFIVNDHAPDRDARLRWLWPTETVMSKYDFADIVSWAPYERYRSNSARNAVRLYIDLSLETKPLVAGIAPVTRVERVSIPLMGRLQPMKDRNTNGKVTY